MKVFAQLWEESERGWGTRPDGTTLHLTVADAEAFIADYNKRYNSEPEVPDEYTRAIGKPFEVDVDRRLHDELAAKADKHGIWYNATKWVTPGDHLEARKAS